MPIRSFGLLARARAASQDAKRDLEQRAAGLKSAQWPFPVIKLFLEQDTPEAMVAAVDKPEERCEAQFYLGHAAGMSIEKRLLRSIATHHGAW